MVGNFRTFCVALAAIVASSGACAMSPEQAQPRCRVVAGEKLLATAGGAEALCAAVEAAVNEKAPNAHYTAEVKVLPKSMLRTAIVVNGRALPEQNFAVMDRDLNPRSIKRFAESIAAKIAEAAKG